MAESEVKRKRIWQSRKGFAEKMGYKLTNELKDRITGELIQPERFIIPSAVGQYTISADSPYYDQEVKTMLKIAKNEDMIELKADKEGRFPFEGCILPEVLPPDPEREVEELKALKAEGDKRIAELEALLKKQQGK